MTDLIVLVHFRSVDLKCFPVIVCGSLRRFYQHLACDMSEKRWCSIAVGSYLTVLLLPLFVIIIMLMRTFSGAMTYEAYMIDSVFYAALHHCHTLCSV